MGEWRCTRMGERMCTPRNIFPSPPRLLRLCLCHLLRRLLYLLHSPLFLQRCEMTLLLAASVKSTALPSPGTQGRLRTRRHEGGAWEE